MIVTGAGRGSYSTLYPADVLDLSQVTWVGPENSLGELYFSSYLRGDPYTVNSSGVGTIQRNPAATAAMDTRSTAFNKTDSFVGFQSPWLYAVRGFPNEVIFKSPVFGASTTPSATSNDARSECRTTKGGAGAVKAQNFVKANVATLRGVCRVIQRPHNNEIFIGQIHADDKAFMTLKLDKNNKLTSAVRNLAGSTVRTDTLRTGVIEGDVITWQVTFGPSDNLFWSVSINGDTATTFTQPTPADVATTDMYGKFGCYFNLYNTDAGYGQPQDDYQIALANGYVLPKDQYTDYGAVAYREFTLSFAA